ncbi:MAG: hypothetical protein ACKKL6_01560 [Candidatus Komeilibacteria bacterium]
MTKNIQLSSIFIQDPIHAHALGDVYIVDDQSSVEQKGHFFILANMQNPKPDYERFLGAFIDRAKHTYYESHLEDSTKLLEHTLNDLNKWLPENLPEQKKILGQLNIIVGNLKDNVLNIAYIGEWRGFLMHKTKAIDVLGKTPPPINPIKLFENVITGNLDHGLSFILTNPSLLDYLALDKIRKILSTIPAKSAAEQIKNMVAEVPTHVTFASLIIKNSEVDSEQPVPAFIAHKERQQEVENVAQTTKIPREAVRHSRESIDRLINTQSETQRVLTVPSSWQTIKAGMDNLTTSLKEAGILSKIFKYIGLLFTYIWLGIKFIFQILVYLVKRLYILIMALVKPNKQLPKIKIPNKIKDIKLNKKSKIILSAIIALIIILLLIIVPKGDTSNLTEEQLTNIDLELKNREETIEASLIYGDRIKAQGILTEILDLLEPLPAESKKYQAEIDALNQRANILTERIWNIMEIDAPVSLFNIKEINNNANILDIAMEGDKAYIFTDSNQYYIFDLTDKGYQTVDYPSNFAGLDKTAISPAQDILVVDNNKQFFIATTEGLQPVLISLAAGLQDITAMTSFYNRLYILDAATDQIYRHRLSGTTYLSPDTWLKENNDLANTKDISIDGYVYILNGTSIDKYINGRQESFPSISIYPEVTNPTKLYTDLNANDIYILEPDNKRALVFDKGGKLVKQFHSDSFNNIVDFAVQEEAKRMLIVADGQLYIIPL